MKKMLLIATVIMVTGCVSTGSSGPSLAEMDFNTMTCDEITAAFQSYRDSKSTVSSFSNIASAVGVNTAVVGQATNASDTIYYNAANVARPIAAAKGCRTSF